MVAELDDFPLDAADDAILVLWDLSVLENVLDDIVSKLIIGELVDISHDCVQDGPCLVVSAILKNPLYDSASVGVQTELADSLGLVKHRVDDELDRLLRHLLDAFLDHMVAILIIDTVKHCILQLLYEELLLIESDHFEGLLHNPTAVHGLCQLENIAEELLCESGALELGPVLKEFLDHIVTEHVVH